ncbi:hypothetical protein DSM104329_02886 [Capillimicrobium parvum]|uniref:Uncharacterized protein n=1 Tax=Capillimicrobium parvum TaxID=2884022 RepID=A0A9E7C0J4_9ACTN|nr:hypothetical protein DSM104329_02886 [Capillimicrobium parvum]
MLMAHPEWKAGITVRLRRVSVLGVMLAGVLTISACGGGGDSSSSTPSTPAGTATAEATNSSFCDQIAGIADSIDVNIDTIDPADLGPRLDKAAKALKAVDPPPEISGAWNTLIDFYDQFGVAFNNLDLTDAAASGKLGEALTKLQANAQKLAGASQEVAQYASKNCTG